MADRALTEEAVLAGLQDIRLPANAPGGLIAELFAIIALALVVAALLGLLLRTVTLFRPKRREMTVQEQAGILSELPEDARRLALLRLLKNTRPRAFETLAKDLYGPGGLPDLEVLEAEVARND